MRTKNRRNLTLAALSLIAVCLSAAELPAPQKVLPSAPYSAASQEVRKGITEERYLSPLTVDDARK